MAGTENADKKRKFDVLFDDLAKDAVLQARRNHVPGVLLGLVCREVEASGVWKKDDVTENELYAFVNGFNPEDMSVIVNGEKFQLAMIGKKSIYYKNGNGISYENLENDNGGDENEDDDEDYEPDEEDEEEEEEEGEAKETEISQKQDDQ